MTWVAMSSAPNQRRYRYNGIEWESNQWLSLITQIIRIHTTFSLHYKEKRTPDPFKVNQSCQYNCWCLVCGGASSGPRWLERGRCGSPSPSMASSIDWQRPAIPPNKINGLKMQADKTRSAVIGAPVKAAVKTPPFVKTVQQSSIGAAVTVGFAKSRFSYPTFPNFA